MSHRKFEAPRHGHLGFLPKKKSKTFRPRIQSFQPDVKSAKPHLSAFFGYKAGMTHIVREVNRPGSKMHKREVVEAVTIVDTPPIVVIGVTGYSQTQFGLKKLSTVWAQHLNLEVRKRFIKNWSFSKKLAFTKHAKAYNKRVGRKARSASLEILNKQADIIRIIAHTQILRVPTGSKRAHIAEIQINGGSTAEKVQFAKSLFEKYIPVSEVFSKNESIDAVAITKGHGFTGVTSRWGVTRLPRKSHKGLRKVACIGAWHPARVMWTVARAGQKGFFRRVAIHKKIYLVGKSRLTEEGKFNAMTPFDLTKKDINPMGGFPNYGYVNNDFLILNGTIPGVSRRFIALRKTIRPPQTRKMLEDVTLKFIDTSSKLGRGRFQTSDEKTKYLGPLKKDLEKKRREDVEKSKALQQETGEKGTKRAQ